MVESLLKNILDLPRIPNPVTGNPITLEQRSLSAAWDYWQNKGLPLERIIERVLETDSSTYETHTVLCNEAYALGDRLGLAPQEVEHILDTLPERFVEIADLLEAMSREPLDDSLLMAAPSAQTMQ